MFDLLSDILSALSKNKLRTALTGFSMAWGIFMLITLLGCGNGLMNAMMLNFSDKSNNITYMFPGRTSKPFKGLQAGRRMLIEDDCLEELKKQVPQIGRIAPTKQVWGVTETYNGEYTSGGGIYGVTQEYFELADFRLLSGRVINKFDMDLKRKVMILHQDKVKVLFKGENPLGKYVVVNNVPYQVIGTYGSRGMEQNQMDVVPLSTMSMVYASNRGYNNILLEVNGVTDTEGSEKFERDLRAALSAKLQFDPEDSSAVWIWNAIGSYLETLSIFTGIRIFLWLITIGTLIAGVVGIGNIMLVTVKERTKEFGIRKSLGARPSGIMSLILSESLLITLSFGYMGMLGGILLLEGLNKLFPMPEEPSFENPTSFVAPSVDLSVAVMAILILVAAGLTAAYFPAKKAVSVKPVEAMHYE